MPTDAKIAPQKRLGAFEVLGFLQNCKNGRVALGGITYVKGTSVDIFFYFFEKVGKNDFWHLKVLRT